MKKAVLYLIIVLALAAAQTCSVYRTGKGLPRAEASEQE